MHEPYNVGKLSFEFPNNSLEFLREAIKNLNEEDLKKARIGSKLAIDSASAIDRISALTNDKELVTLLDALGSKKLKLDILSKLWLKIITCRRDRYCLDILLYKFFGVDCFESRIEISIMKPGSFIPPHVDAIKKIFSGLIYLPSDIQNESLELGTEFWRYDKSNYKNVHLDNPVDLKAFNDNAILEYKAPFKKTGMVYFLRNSKSWHSVSKVSGEPRLSLNYNIQIKTSITQAIKQKFKSLIKRN